MFNIKLYFSTSNTISANVKKIRFVVVAITLFRNGPRSKRSVKTISNTEEEQPSASTQPRIQWPQLDHCYAKLPSADTEFIQQVNKIIHDLKEKKNSYKPTGFREQCVDECKKITGE